MNASFAHRFCVAVLLAGYLSLAGTGCSSWKLGDSLPSLDPQVRREREITQQAKNDPFPAAGMSTTK